MPGILPPPYIPRRPSGGGVRIGRVTTEPAPVVRPLSEADADAVFDVDLWAFGFDPQYADYDAARAFLEWDRVAGAFLGDRLAGIHAVLSLEMPVPGGASVRAGGLTWVGVHPELRRRGLLGAMMRHHLDAVRNAGETVSILYAAEPAIYGRFGYGLATQDVKLTVGRGAALRDVPGADDVTVSFETADIAKHKDLVVEVFDRARAVRPGWASRPGTALRESIFSTRAPHLRQSEPQRLLIARDAAGDVRGYAFFVRKLDWGNAGSNGTTRVSEVVALDATAARALWGRLLDLDLQAKVEIGRRPQDDPLLHLLVDSRAAAPTLLDGLWLRVVDLPAALAARRYSAELDVVLEVTDALLPANAGRWRVKGGPDAACCERTDDEPDLALDVRDLGAAYLGGTTLPALAAAGLLTEHRPGALARAAAGFAWPVAPYCGWSF
jgi:predicted acetyltransferase